MSICKNDIIKIEITAMSSEGVGIGRTNDNMVIFVPNSAIGDVLNVRVLKVQKNLSYGKIEEVLEPSIDRIESDCDVFSKCGGCSYRHISYEKELDIKKKKVYDALTRIGKLEDIRLNEIVSTDRVNGYRNKAQIPVTTIDGKVQMGFYSKHSHRICNCLDCKLSPNVFNEISKCVYDFLSAHSELPYDEKSKKGYIRHLYLRIAEKTNEVMVCFVVNGNSFPFQDEIIKEILDKFDNVKSILINVNKKDTNVVLGNKNIVLYGEEYITDILCGLKFRISPQSFYQVNRDAAEKLYNLAKKYSNLSKDDNVIDLYCGTGTIGLSLADSCKSVLGIEVVEKAIHDANINKEINNINNASFICSDAKDLEDSIDADIIVVDPPRKGLSADLIDKVSSLRPKRLVYVSCNPATLARDLQLLCDNDFIVSEVTPVDLFPRTYHVETVVLLDDVR